jgi:tetratricopeptide (TPR) repeat protein
MPEDPDLSLPRAIVEL